MDDVDESSSTEEEARARLSTDLPAISHTSLRLAIDVAVAIVIIVATTTAASCQHCYYCHARSKHCSIPELISTMGRRFLKVKFLAAIQLSLNIG